VNLKAHLFTDFSILQPNKNPFRNNINWAVITVNGFLIHSIQEFRTKNYQIYRVIFF
jgi:hypothetical protein